MEPTEKNIHTEKSLYEKEACCRGPNHQAYLILRFTFALIPILAGLDKFFNFLTIWEQYLSQPFNVLGNAHTTMILVGIIEIIAGIGVWLKPKIFSLIVAIWLLAIIINLLALGNFFDIALRDLGLLLGALSLARLSCKHDDLRCCRK
jgi:uncharacterized membrane protein YphA (DoxX/SURF4 family)